MRLDELIARLESMRDEQHVPVERPVEVDIEYPHSLDGCVTIGEVEWNGDKVVLR